MNGTKITLEEVKELRATLEGLLLLQGKATSNMYERSVMMDLYNMEHSLSRNRPVDEASDVIHDKTAIVNGWGHCIEKCRPEVVKHLKPFVDKHTVRLPHYKPSFYEKTVTTIVTLGIVCVPIAIIYFVIKLIFF